MTTNPRSLRRTTQHGATALAWATCSLLVAAGLADLVLTIAHETGTRHTVRLSDVFASLGASIACLAFTVVGAVIVTRRPSNRIGWLMLAFGLVLGFTNFAGDYPKVAILSAHRILPWRMWANWASTWALDPGLYVFFLLLLLFPTGRLISPRLKPLVWVGSVAVLLSALVDMFGQGPLRNSPAIPGINPLGLVSVPTVISGPVIIAELACILLAAAALVRRFWVSRDVERQQLKWFTYAIGVLFAVFLAAAISNTFSGPLGGLLLLAVIAVPVSMGMAILRYRLYDIDLLINRTLVYGMLTVSLGLLYIGGVVTLQALLRLATGQGSGLAVAISTLAIAALFQPFRRGIQSFIDHRFYRRKYDAAQTLASLGTRIRDDIDLDQVTAEIVTVVQETMQPAHVSLWLRN